jgi:hypothetical protein
MAPRFYGGKISNSCEDTDETRRLRGYPKQKRRDIVRGAAVRMLKIAYSCQRLKISEPFVPPNPNEFDSAYSASIGCGLFGT